MHLRAAQITKTSAYLCVLCGELLLLLIVRWGSYLTPTYRLWWVSGQYSEKSLY